VKLLIDRGAKKVRVQRRKHVPIVTAAASGHVDIVRHLDSIGVPLWSVTSADECAFDAACTNSQVGVLMYFIERGEVTRTETAKRIMQALNLRNLANADCWVNLFWQWKDAWTDADYRTFVGMVLRLGEGVCDGGVRACVALMVEGPPQKSQLAADLAEDSRLKPLVEAMGQRDREAFFDLYSPVKRQWIKLTKSKRR
jgi:hypothetical protein